MRDHLLGATLLNGSGEVLHFGGQVIKNVAGYDVSRVLAGSLGTLGIILEVSLKVLPMAGSRDDAALRHEAGRGAGARSTPGAASRLPLDASAWWNGNLVLRLRGARGRGRGGEPPARRRRDRAGRRRAVLARPARPRDEFFLAANEAIEHQDAALWRLSLPQTAPLLGLAGDELIEWHGGAALARAPRCRRRWCARPRPASAAMRRCSAARDKSAGVFAPLPPPLRAIHRD